MGNLELAVVAWFVEGGALTVEFVELGLEALFFFQGGDGELEGGSAPSAG